MVALSELKLNENSKHDEVVMYQNMLRANLVPRVRVTLDQRSGTRDSGIKRFGSHFHWLKSEHEQLDRK